MKKLIAVILAVLLLGSAAAFAEAAPALELKDPVLDFTASGETVRLDLSGLTLRVGVLGEEEEDACLVLNLLGADKPLLTAALRMDGERVLLAADGFSHSYALPVAGTSAALSPAGADGEGPDLDALVSALTEKVLSQAEIGMEGDAITFRLPYTAVSELLRELVPLMGSAPNAEGLQEALDEMEASGESVELSGSVSGNGGVHAELNVTPVSGGTLLSEDTRRLLFDLETLEDGGDFYLFCLKPAEGNDPVFRMEGSFRTGEQGLTTHCDVFADAEAIAAGAPSLVLDLAAGKDVSFTLSAPDAFLFDLRFAREAGTILLNAETEAFKASLTATAVSGEAELQRCAFPAEVIELSGELSEEQQNELTQEMQVAIMPVLSFVMRAAAGSGLFG